MDTAGFLYRGQIMAGFRKSMKNFADRNISYVNLSVFILFWKTGKVWNSYTQKHIWVRQFIWIPAVRKKFGTISPVRTAI